MGLKVLMFGWEFPPNNKGGLGTACFGLTKALSSKGTQITLVLPKGNAAEMSNHVDVVITENLHIGNRRIKVRKVDTLLAPYMTEQEYERSYSSLMGKDASASGDIYGKNLFDEVNRYAEKAKVIAGFETFDVIHCHDWMTFKAGIKAKQLSGRPLIVHVHATEFDRTGGHPNQLVYDMEREGMHAADNVITVSNYTKGMICQHYGVPPEKVTVVHNGIDRSEQCLKSKPKRDGKTVLFLGRMTLQKGPDYFIDAAKKVIDLEPETTFVMAGTGDMFTKMIERAAHHDIGHKVLFTGHLSGEDISKAYRMADLYVMPSVSEPFGIAPLEALNNNTPVLISKQSGVSEVLTNALKVDFWDVDEMVNKIVCSLRYPAMTETLAENGTGEISSISWECAADKCINVYNGLANGGSA